MTANVAPNVAPGASSAGASSSSSRSTRSSATSSTPDVEKRPPFPTSSDADTAQEKDAGNEKDVGGAAEEVPSSDAEKYDYNPGRRLFATEGKHREKWWQIWRPKNLPPPPPFSLDDATTIPLATANVLSKITYQWATPIMVLGYQRPLESTDLWAMDKSRQAEHLARKLNESWLKRVEAANEKNRRLESGETAPGWARRTRWALGSAVQKSTGRSGQYDMAAREAEWRSPPPTKSAAPSGKKAPNRSGHVRPSLLGALHDQFGWELWIGLIFKVIGDTSQVTAPLVVKEIIKFGQKAYAAHTHPNDPAYPKPDVGHGIGLAFALFFMQLLSSLCQHQFFFRSMSVGVLARASLISSIFERALKMNGKARASGKLINHISTDVSRIDFAAGWVTVVIAAPIQIIVCLIILLTQIKASALAGFGLLVIATPLQTRAMKALFQTRRASMGWTDKRAKLIQELLNGMRIVKSFAHESNFLRRLDFIRRSELKGIRKILIIRSANNAIAFSLPVLAAVLAFVTYSLSGHDLNPAVIFTSLTLFQLLRMPLMFLPLTLSAITDGMNALERLHEVFTAEQIVDTAETDFDNKYGIVVDRGTFRWENTEPAGAAAGPQGKGAQGKGASPADTKTGPSDHKAKSIAKRVLRMAGPAAKLAGLPQPISAKSASNKARTVEQNQNEQAAGVAGDNSEVTADEAHLEPTPADGFIDPEDGAEGKDSDTSKMPRDGTVSGLGAARALAVAAAGLDLPVESAAGAAAQEPFHIREFSLHIPRGELCAIVGPVGSGKSSLLQALVGEMRKVDGRVIWGNARVGYCAQSAWIQNATLRDNIVFGQPWEEERYWEAVKLSELESDLEILPSGDMTEIGEKGINLSGGQKQRVNIARALYYDADIVCLDDPLSAVDAHVGKALFNNVIMGLRRRGKTVLLVTHALHFLPDVDRIITLVDGAIVEEGTYDELVRSQGAFSRLVAEFGGEQEAENEKQLEDEEVGIEEANGKRATHRAAMTDSGGKKGGALMQAEERNTGSVPARVYAAYFNAGHGIVMVPLIIGALALMQVATVLNSYWLIWWQNDHFHQSQGFYMGIYAALGIAQTICTFCMGATMGILSYHACKNLHANAIRRVMHAPMSWFDTTPIGRITNRFSKDVDVVDNQLADAYRMAVNTMASVLGAVILITILTHYFIIAVAVILIFYYYAALFYRSSARELKRLDAILRSSLYSHFTETLSGLPTIRAYRESPRFLRDNHKRMDVENRAYFMTITNQRWLGVRLDFLGALLVLIVAILATAGGTTIEPGQVGVALTYILTVSQAFSWMTRQIAEVENDMNSAERIIHYADSLEQEAPQEIPEAHLPDTWPDQGSIEMRDVVMSYRPGLPTVLKGISMKILPAEKIGIVGRTGAGKSSILTALLRLVELSSGSIHLDGVDISTIGLKDLRSRMAILPQDPLLFSGTLRSNLDPFDQYDDGRLWDALKRAFLVSDNAVGGGSAGGSAAASRRPSAGDALAGPDGAVPSTLQQVLPTSSRFTLDTVIEEEGNNLSVGERSLVSLARALVKDSQIILLDEATASVDVETDAKIQETIRREFKHKTLLCIAHRLRTIITYDRVVVLDAGRVAEMDSPLKLFDTPGGIFREMCERSNIKRAEVEKSGFTED